MELEDKTYIVYDVIREYVNKYMDDAQDLVDEAYEDESGRYDDNYISYQTGKVDALWDVLNVITSLTPLTSDDIFSSSPVPKYETVDAYEDNGLVTMSLDTLKKVLTNAEFRVELLPILLKFQRETESKQFGYQLHSKEIN